MVKIPKIFSIFLISLIGGAAIGVILNLMAPGGFSFAGLIGIGIFSGICLFALIVTWNWAGAGKTLGWMMALAFGLRLIVGVGLSLALPEFGYDTPTQNAGYIFLDAFQRDQQAWNLAKSGESIFNAFGSEFFTDQYGGMLATSAGLYRLFSPDLHRPWLILVLTAAIAALAVPFLKLSLNSFLGQKVSDIASWIFVLYPESVLLGAAQMRDPILIGLSAISFWGALSLKEKRWSAVTVMVITILVMAIFSWLVAVPLLAVLLLFIWVREQSGFSRNLRRLFWAGILFAGLVGFVAIASWLRESAMWDAYLTEQGSGWLQVLFAGKPDLFKLVFLAIYGLAQPVLPAAVFDPSVPISNAITTFRSLGWYLLLPILLYMPFGLRKESDGQKRNFLILSYLVFLIWTIVSSLRAGGDLWDNPRYRTIFIIWLAISAAWGWVKARETKDRWLIRWIGVEVVFLGVFSIWYANRTFGWGLPIPFYGMVAVIVLMAVGILAFGAIIDFRRRKRV